MSAINSTMSHCDRDLFLDPDIDIDVQVDDYSPLHFSVPCKNQRRIFREFNVNGILTWMSLSLLLLLVTFPFCMPSDHFQGQQHPWSSCNRTRRIISNSSWGIISDGKANYTQDSYCEWLIVAKEPGFSISLEIQYVRTECSYDYLFVFDGESYTRNSTLLASFSGASDHSVTLLASSGKMLILLYSDTNYALEGFQAQYFVTPCPLNCTESEGAGECIPNPDSALPGNKCRCTEGYTGEGCQILDKEVNTLLLPSHTFPNLLPRVGHSATKVHDKVYIFGGFDLNKVLNDLKIYDLHSGHLHHFPPVHHSHLHKDKDRDRDKEDININNNSDNQSQGQGQSEGQETNSVDEKPEKLVKPPHVDFWPMARFGHASTAYESGFFIHGGRLSDGSITNQLLYFNVTTLKWTEYFVDRKIPFLIYHSMTLTPSGIIYVYGGGTPNGSFSSKLFRFQGDSTEGGWEEIHSVCCGKAKDRSVLGHSAVYWKNSLIIFGGVTVDIGRFSKISSQLWMFVLESEGGKGAWMEIQYKRNSNFNNFNSLLYKSSVGGGGIGVGGGSTPQWGHMERAFHSINVIGNHLLIIGGYTHSHNKDETCYSNVMLVYNLECQQFLQDLPLRISGGMEQGHGHKANEGVFGHRSIVFKDRVFILGGYRGYLDGRIRSIPLPFKIHKDHEDDCVYYDKWRCSGDPQCGWCPTDLKCYDKVTGSKNCTTNLQTSQCPGICPLMTSCQSCVILDCNWCDALQQCLPKGQDSARQCQSRNSAVPSGVSVDYKSCVSHYERQGVTILEYRNPPDPNNPDQVKVTNSTIFRVQRESSSLVDNTGPSMMIMKGFLVGVLQSPRRIELCASQARVNLSMDDEGGGHQVKNNVSLKPTATATATGSNSDDGGSGSGGSGENLTTHLNWSAHVYCMNLTWPSGKPVMLQPDTRIRFQISANTSRAALDSAIRVFFQQRFMSKNSTNTVPPTRIPKESLVPFMGVSNSTCAEYTTCLACVADSLCGWMGDICGSRSSLSSLDEDILRGSSLVLDLEDCFHCSDLTTCSSCVLHDAKPVPVDPHPHALSLSEDRGAIRMHGGSCEWWEEESSCQRRGRLDTGVKDVGACPMDCHLRKNCSSCLEGPGKCVWCADRGECFVFDVYTTFYQFGQCIDWMDKGEQCQRCARQSKCEDCIRFLGCGWNYDDNGGSCTEGDFQGPLINDEMVVMSSSSSSSSSSGVERNTNTSNTKSLTLTSMTWTYGVCPDIDECLLGIHDCHENATCENTQGSFVCKCKQGFTGDGKKGCEETCFEPCVHGTCSPNFVCECDLGWTGVDCSRDCGCNNHSSCETGVCEECQDLTEGSNCQFCVRGLSYGNATVQSIGCRPCFCNGHGDEEKGVCDLVSGVCFCLNHTAGPDCSLCEPGYFGDPRSGQPCYKDCDGRSVMDTPFGYFAFSKTKSKNGRRGSSSSSSSSSKMGLTSTSSDALSPFPVEHCMWILKQSDRKSRDNSLKRKVRKIRISVSYGYNIPCSQNALNIYAGIPSFTKTRKDSTLVASVCSPLSTDNAEGWPWPPPTSSPLSASAPSSTSTLSSSSSSSVPRTLDIYVESEVVTVVLRSVGNHSTSTQFNASYKLLLDNDSGSSSSTSTSMLTFTLANSRIPVTRLYDGQSVFSRFGHTLHADEKNVWIFGGYSLSHGALNDVRQFSRDIGKWIPLTIFVTHDSVNNEDSVPSARYFHAGAMGPPNSFMAGSFIIHGGLAQNMSFLGDTWRFDTRVSRWSKMGKDSSQNKDSALKLAGHTITLHWQEGDHTQNPEFVLIGGFNTEGGFSNRTFSMTLDSSSGVISEWEEVTTTGAIPVGIYGHSAVYHPPTDAFYIFGGFLYDTGKVFVSNHLFALHWPSKKWTMLPPTEENQVTVLPVPRFFHSAVTTGTYMVIMGGAGSWHNTSVLAYNYKCNLWTLLEGENSRVDRTGGAASVWGEQLLTMGGWDWGMATTSESLFQLNLPLDLCSVQSSGEKCKATLGCSYCFSNNNQSQQCYSAELQMPRECSLRPNNTELKIDFKGGTVCSGKWMEGRNCNQYLSCTECLSTWPSHPDSSSVCQWCTNCQVGRCIPLGKKCGEENSCSQKQRETLDVGHCPERACSSSECDKCIGAGKCVWTRQILRSSEWSWKLHSKPVYDWNCVRKQIVNTSTTSYKVVASPPEPCPLPCVTYKTCETCLSSIGGEGGFQECRWSLSKNLCISPAHTHLLCFGGVCGPILSGHPQLCPRPCSIFSSCSSCLRNPSCGWCAREGRNGEGQCLPGDFISSQTQNCSGAPSLRDSVSSNNNNNNNSTSNSWNYLECPMENECENGHHSCDPISEKCIDLEEGFRCECRIGYMEEEGECVPICEGGCIHGTCVAPSVCQCHFGYVGSNCSAQCNCNGHSNCGGVDDLNNCLQCMNDTMGSQCSKCKPLFVGDPRNGRPCISCFDYCNGHSNVCVAPDMVGQVCKNNGSGKPWDETDALHRMRTLTSLIREGPLGDAHCCACQHKTNGSKCDNCIAGYFRGSEDKRKACRKCECHGHGDTCDPVTGTECICHNNTESDHCSQNPSKIGIGGCWKSQCAKCKDSYLGNPTNGHQCYRHMFVDNEYCFDPKSQEYCSQKPKHLLSGRTVFFAVQPKFMNVNIRINLDVTYGAVHVYLSPKDDTFVIAPDQNTWMHQVKFDRKYGLGGDQDNSHVEDHRSGGIFPVGGGGGGNGNGNNGNGNGNKGEDANGDTGSGMNVTGEEEGIAMAHRVPPPFRLVEEEAAGFATHVTLDDYRAVLLVRNVRSRLVVTLPQDAHDLRLTRFYIVLEGVGDISSGSISFRQDQLHIDLFVFFSVFFSAFFLFLAACGIAWKVKQNMETRRARHRHVAEMLSMAKRPFAVWTLILEPEASSPLYQAYTQCRKTCRKGCICLRPLAIESTHEGASGVCTMLISLPGGSAAPVRLCLASTLAYLTRSYPQIHSRRRRR